ncbi:copper resistance CopC family protein [Microbispora sp. H11081]|uniref:copper resistance CopC family protein n=1 Tax=Microbispora sp. H11081 TaxID=2729107 RepID=UPI001473021C|nr:copper resistance CopC family protein [Microbispora sp. H11081]
MDQVARMCNDAPAPRMGGRTTLRTAPPPAAVRGSSRHGFSRHGLARLVAAPLLALIAVLLVATPARAHDVLIGSDPRDGAVLGAMPATVTLTFNQVVRRDYARVAVTGPDGAHFEQGEVKVDGPRVSIGLRTDAPAGAYAIGYRIVSNDGHPVTGTVKFSVSGTGAGTGAAQGSAGQQTAQPTAPTAAETAGPGTADSGTANSGTAGAGSGTGSGQGGGSWVWGLLAVTAALLALCARVLVKHDRRVAEGTVPAPPADTAGNAEADAAADPVGNTAAAPAAATAAATARAASPSGTAGGSKTGSKTGRTKAGGTA